MSPIFFFRPVLDKLNDGKVIRTGVALALRILGILCLLGGFYLLIDVLKTSFSLSTEGTVGGVLFAILLLAAILAVVQILFFRATDIKSLGVSPFTVIPIFSILFRAVGEIYATFAVAVGIGGCLFAWLSGLNPLLIMGGAGGFFPSVPGGNTFLTGLLFLVALAVAAFVSLLVFYFLAESVVVLVDIASNMRLLVRQSGGTSQG
jgi:hypothetical protein